MANQVRHFGLVDAPSRKLVTAAMPVYETSALLASEPSTPIKLYMAWRSLLGDYPNYPAQEAGSCTGFAAGHANDLREAIQCWNGKTSGYQETCTEALYAAGREVAGMILNPEYQDGCYGSAVTQAAMTIGMIPRSSVGPYSGLRDQQWGWTGFPQEYRDQAKKNTLQGTALITTRQALISALWNGMPVTVASNQGFVLRRDAQGFCKKSGQWAHDMCIAGFDPRLNRYLLLQNWGNHSPTGPQYLKQPLFSFWAAAGLVEVQMLPWGDSWAWMSAPAFALNPQAVPPEWTTHDDD